MAAWRLATLVLLLAASVLGDDGSDGEEVLVCYTCTMSDPADDSCYEDPDNSGSTPTTECKLGAAQCCITSRTDASDTLGYPLSMFRGCVQDCDPSLIGKLVTTPTYAVTTYETYCNEDRCNNGPGNTKPGSGSGGGAIIDGIAGLTGQGGGRLEVAPLALGLVCLSLARLLL